MSTPQLPSIELIQGSPRPSPPSARSNGLRWKTFFGVLIVATLIGLAIVYAREPIYRATASVLTVKPKAVDTRSAEADAEHVAIQGRLLMGEELLGRLVTRLSDEGDELDLDQLRNALAVFPVPETNLLELRAEGGSPEQLQRMVNLWAESYETFRAEEIEAASGRTIAEIQDEQAQLNTRIEQARLELQTFRETHDIVSLERSENRSLSSLKGLNNSLNKAREKQIEAQARTAAIEEAIADGETVIPNEQKSQIAKLRLRVQRMQIRLNDLRQKYTQRYIDRDPVLKSLPGELSGMQQELRAALEIARQTVSDEAKQAVIAADASVAALENKLEEQQGKVQTFTQRFKEFKALEDSAARLDNLYAANEQRLAQIQVRNLKKYPPIQVVEWARVPSRPIYPDYDRDLMIALGSALLLALFSTWLVEYLSPKPEADSAAPYLGVRVIGGEAPQTLGGQPAQDLLRRQSPPHGQLASPTSAPSTTPSGGPADSLPILPRELATAEVQSLLAVSDTMLSGYATLLLSGVSPYELPLLHAACFSDADRRLDIPGASARALSLVPACWDSLADIRHLMDDAQMALPIAEIDRQLLHAAQTAGLADSQGVDALALWHTYVVYLVRQGIDASSLGRRVGAIPQDVFGALKHFAPPDGNRPLGSIAFTYPALGA